MDENSKGSGLAYRSPARAVFFFFLMALLVWGVWSEGIISNWVALGLLVVAAVVGWWMIRTRPEDDEADAETYRSLRR